MRIEYFSDVLCVWAWISQRRIDELKAHFGDKIEVHSACVDVFGDTATRIGAGWADKGGYEGFGRHVQESAAPYDSAKVNPEVWRSARPATSGTAHLYIKAAGIAHDAATAERLALAVRKAFFEKGRDIADQVTLDETARSAGCDLPALRNAIDNGDAMGALLGDYQRARNLGVKGSPVFLMNENRQMLYGNVGYRVLQANVEELLKRPIAEASWC